MQSGESATLILTQDATGGRIVTLPANCTLIPGNASATGLRLNLSPNSITTVNINKVGSIYYLQELSGNAGVQTLTNTQSFIGSNTYYNPLSGFNYTTRGTAQLIQMTGGAIVPTVSRTGAAGAGISTLAAPLAIDTTFTEGAVRFNGIHSLTGTPNLLAIGTDSLLHQVPYPSASGSSAGSSGDIQLANGSGGFTTPSTSLLHYDVTNARAGINVASPAFSIDILNTSGNPTAIQLTNNSATQYSGSAFYNNAGNF